MSKINKALRLLIEGTEQAPRVEKASPTERDYGIDGANVPLNGTRDNRLSDVRRGGSESGSISKRAINVSEKSLIKQGLHADYDNFDAIAEQFRRIKRPILNIAFGEVRSDKNSNVIMVTSGLPKTGKTFCSYNLAMSIARERDVGSVLVDADVLKPSTTRAFGLEKHLGLVDYLLDSSITVDDILVATDRHGIIVLPAGRQHEETTELLASQRMTSLVQTLSGRFSDRAIVVDTPPLLLTNEAHVLSEHMGQIILVVEIGESTQDSVQHALSSLDESKPINAILNKAPGASFGEYGEYGYGYGYGR